MCQFCGINAEEMPLRCVDKWCTGEAEQLKPVVVQAIRLNGLRDGW